MRMKFSVHTVLANGLAHVPGGFAGGLPGGAIGAVSSLLIGELADALRLTGFEHGLFQSIGTTVTNQLLTNAYGVATAAVVPAPASSSRCSTASIPGRSSPTSPARSAASSAQRSPPIS